MVDKNDVINVQEAAELLNAHIETIRRLARKGAIPAFKLGKDWRFRKSALLAWSETHPGVKKEVCIQVIDDDPGICRLMRRHLEPLGYRVITASTGIDGLAQLDREAVHLVLLDLVMPVMSGAEFIREIRTAGLEIPVLIVTGYPDSDLMMDACRFGPLTLIPKPIEKQMLIAAVNLVLGGALTTRAV